MDKSYDQQSINNQVTLSIIQHNTQDQLANLHLIQLFQLKSHQLNASIFKLTGKQFKNWKPFNYQSLLYNLSIVEQLVKEKQNFAESARMWQHYRRKTDQLILSKEETLQQVERKQRLIDSQKIILSAKKEQLQKQNKLKIDRLVHQKDELYKQLKKMQAREKGFEVELRKKQNQIRYLQESIKKVQQKSTARNSTKFDIIQSIKLEEAQGHKKNEVKWEIEMEIEKGYDMLALHKFEDMVHQIRQENQILRQQIIRLQNGINSIFEALPNQLNLNSLQFNGEHAVDVVRGRIDQIVCRLTLCRQFVLNQLCHSNSPQKEPQFTEQIPKIQQLIQNFKQIIKSQHQLLTEIIPNPDFMNNNSKLFLDIPVNNKCQTYPSYHVSGKNSKKKSQICAEAVQKQKFQKLKEIIGEQIAQVQQKNRRLNRTKQKLVQGLKKTEKIKDSLKGSLENNSF